MTPSPLKHFFEPESIAVIGTSRTKGRPGYTVVENLTREGFTGKIYPIHPEAKEILGLRTFTNIEEVPYDVEMALSLAPVSETRQVVEQCIRKGVKGIEILTGGFSEVGEEGQSLEKEIVSLATNAGVRIMGPNVVGPMNSKNNLIVTLGPFKIARKGSVALICQSGNLLHPKEEWMFSFHRMGISKSIDLGNKSDIDDVDVLEYLKDDPDTNVIIIHMEGVKRGREFLRVAREVSRKKPVVVYKTGTTEAGSKAAYSHTASLTGSNQVYDAAFKQAGIVRADSIEELMDFAKAFAFLRPPQGNRVGIIANSGAAAVIASDACEQCGLKVAPIVPQTVEKLGKVFPLQLVSNPMDVSSFGIWALGPNEAFRITAQAFIEDENTDCLIIFIVCFWGGGYWEPEVSIFEPLVKQRNKPVAIVLTGYADIIAEKAEHYEAIGLPVFPSEERAIKAIAALYHHRNYFTNPC